MHIYIYHHFYTWICQTLHFFLKQGGIFLGIAFSSSIALHFFFKGCVGYFYFLSSVCGAWFALYLFSLDLVVFSFHFGVLVSCFVAVVVLLFDWSFERKWEWDSFLGMSEKDSFYPYYSKILTLAKLAGVKMMMVFLKIPFQAWIIVFEWGIQL